MIRKAQSILMIFLLIGIPFANAQLTDHEWAKASLSVTENNKPANPKLKRLKPVLEKLEKEHNASFMYESGLLDQLFVPYEFELSGNFGQDFRKILQAGNLTYSRLNKNTFVIQKKLTEQSQLPDEHRVSGKVTDAESGKAIAGVNILVKGTSVGASTDQNGRYVLMAPTSHDTLVVSFIGYKQKQIPIRGRSRINIALPKTTVKGKEVTVVAYGEQSTRNLTGSVSSVSTQDITEAPTANVGNALSGKLEGVQTIQGSGLPGGDSPDIFIRGTGSLSEGRSKPIYVLDGIVVSNTTISNLDPNNIKSISVLKDASSLAVYGVQGANGAVVVKTKRGHKGDMRISVNTSSGFQVPTNLAEMANSYDHARMYNLSQINDGVDPDNVRFDDKALKAFKTHSDPIIYPDVDFVDYITKPAAFQSRTNVSLSGGTDDIRYRVTGGYLKQDGIIKTFNSDYDFNPSFNRYNFRSNIDFDASSTTKLSLTASGRMEKRVRMNIKGGYLSNWAQIYRAVPYAGPGIVDGKLVQTGNRYIPGRTQGIMEQFYHSGYTRKSKNALNLQISATQELNALTKGLKFSLKGAYNTHFTKIQDRPQSVAAYEPFYRTDVDPTASANDSSIVYKKLGSDSKLRYYESYGKDRDWYVEGRLKYSRDFGRHSVEGLLLYSQERNFYPSSYTGIPRGLVSTVGRINYNFDQRYLLEVSAGYNGSENFAEGNRFGFFPAASVGWILTNEPYFPDISFLSFLKLRASYGVTGNDSGIGRFLYLPGTYNPSAGGYNFGYNISGNSGGAAEGALGNPLVQWEKSTKQDYGANIHLFDDQLELKFDYFKEIRSNILTSRSTVPSVVSANLPAVNIGRVQNKGYEAKFTWNQSFHNFLFKLGGNVSFARSKILYMDEVHRDEPYQKRTGEPVGQPFGYVFDGYYTKEEVQNIGNGVPDPGYSAKPGDLKYKDLNGDGVVDGADQAPIGYPRVPEYTFGAHFTVGYKNIQLSTDWAAATNTSRQLNYVPTRTPFGPRGGRTIMQWQVDGHWTPEKGQNAEYPRMSLVARGRRNKQFSDFWQRDASYIRLKNAQLAYNFGPELTNSLGLQDLSVYLSGYNLLTISKLDILDPEISGGSFGLPYPLMKVYNFGVKVQL